MFFEDLIVSFVRGSCYLYVHLAVPEIFWESQLVYEVCYFFAIFFLFYKSADDLIPVNFSHSLSIIDHGVSQDCFVYINMETCINQRCQRLC